MSDFAKNQLLKFGWREGKGLGKEESGITKPVKITPQFGFKGLGYKETLETWWDKKFNDVLQNIRVESNQDGVTLSTIDDKEDFFRKYESKFQQTRDNFEKASISQFDYAMENNFATLEEKEKTAQDSISISSPIEQFHTARNNEIVINITTSSSEVPAISSAKLRRIALQDQSLVSAISHGSLFTYSSSNNLHCLLSRLSNRKHTSETKSKYEMLNKVNSPSEEEEEDETNNNNNIMIQTLRNLRSQSRSRSRKFRKKMNNLMQQLNGCSIKETNTKPKCDLLKDQFLQNLKNKECIKTRKRFECAQSMKKESCTTKEDTSKQTRSQNEKECGSIQIIQFGTNEVTPSSKEERIVKESTCLITLKKFGASQHKNPDTASARNIKNSLYFHKCKKKRRNKKHQRSKIEDVIKNIANKRDIDVVEKALREINLTEDVSAAIKKKPTQTHITPV